MKTSRRLFLTLGVAAALFSLSGLFFWLNAPWWVDDPLSQLRSQTPVRTWQDRHGKPIWYERTYDYQWRFAVPLSDVSEDTLRVILAAEDARFYEHSGVDYEALMRALWQNISNLRIVSGASTISMQLAGMAIPTSERGFSRKWKQAALARKMEQCHSKDEILQEYLNRIPFGGKIYGIEAAARYYFGLHAAELNLSKSTLLCGVPQRPNRLRPDRHLSAARERQKTILKLLVTHGEISSQQAEELFHNQSLQLRNFQVPSDFEQLSSPDELFHFIQASSKLNRGKNSPQPDSQFLVRLSFDVELQKRIERILSAQCNRLPQVQDAAALLLDNRTGEVLAYIGTLNFHNPQAGQVDCVQALRSAGSALKPFIYAEAINAGQIVAATKLDDTALRYGDYAPGNYEDTFAGSVSAAQALSRSLNTPVIQLLARLGVGRILESFQQVGLAEPDALYNREVGLSLALGTLGHTLFDLTRAYSLLPNEGTLLEPHFILGEPVHTIRQNIYLPETCRMISMILRELSLPNSAHDIVWKTGTSNNNCDAWCFAYSPDYTLGVWFGNKNGKPSPSLVGAQAAAPAAGEIFDLLYQNQSSPRWFNEIETFELRELCSVSGLTPNAFCTHRQNEYVIPGLPLASCQTCAQTKTTVLKILSPAPQQYVTMGGASLKLSLQINQPMNVHWFLNGRSIGMNLKEYEFPAGHRYTLRAVQETTPSNVQETTSASVQANTSTNEKSSLNTTPAADQSPATAEVHFSVEK